MGRILYAEDDDIIAAIAIDALSRAGHAVGWLEDGEALLTAARFRIPDVVILDQRMPKMNGVCVLRQMRIDPNLAMVPVLMLTGVHGDGDQKIAFYEGADEYLTKPFRIDSLVAAVDRLMNKNIRRVSGLEAFKPNVPKFRPV